MMGKRGDVCRGAYPSNNNNKAMKDSASVQTDRGRPVFFFDQPTRQNRIKGGILRFSMIGGGPQLEGTPLSQQEEQKGESKDLNNQKPSGETFQDEEAGPSTSSVSATPKDQVDAYRRAAPHLLNELAHLLSQHKWSEKDCIPRGIVNILNYSWHDLTAGASLRLRSPAAMAERQRRSKGSLKMEKTPHQLSDDAKEERNAGSFLRKVKANQCEKNKKQSYNGGPNSTGVRISISACSCRDPSGIAQPKQRPYDEPESIRVCQWAVERLRAARNPENLPQPEEDLSKALILRHYGDGKGELNERRRKTSVPLVNGLPQKPEVKLTNPDQQKLHYGINDGSSFIYYPSGCVAVCQSRSGLPCGGFYTNVFSDGQRPVTLVTITPFGYGAVTHPLSSTITAVWDHDGGFMLDNFGNTTKEWSWQTYHRLRSNVIIQVSEEISVKLFSGMSGVLSFRCQNESVHLTLCFVTNKSQLKKMPCLQKENKFTLGAAQELHLLKKPKCPATVPKSAWNPRKTLMVKEEEQQVEPSTLWRRRQNAVRDLQRLQQRVRNAVEAWLDCYRVAIGIKCPDAERLLGGQLGTQPRRAAQSAALPSLNSPERKEAALLHAGRSRKDELRESHRCLSASPEKPQDCLVQIQRILKKQGRNELPVTQIGPLRIHGNIKPESVILSHGQESETPPTSYGPGDMVPLLPSIPLTTCPALLRVALQGGEEQRRRCCCSATLMPVVTDLEYDAFIMGQPLDSKQILVVCVTPPQPSVNTHTATRWDVLEDLFRTRNKNRAMPCTQCQMDSFRLVRYEMSAGMADFGPENVLLQQRHGAAPGMFLMYLKGKLLFVGYIFTSDSCLVEDLQRQICRTRRDHRLGLSLPTE